MILLWGGNKKTRKRISKPQNDIGRSIKTMAKRKLRTFDQVEEKAYREHPDEIESYLKVCFEEYKRSGATSALLSSLRISTPRKRDFNLGGRNRNDLDWDDNAGDSDFAGFNVYRSDTAAGTFTKLNPTLLRLRSTPMAMRRPARSLSTVSRRSTRSGTSPGSPRSARPGRFRPTRRRPRALRASPRS